MITKKDVEDLSKKTGCGLVQCKDALSKSNGDALLAEGFLRYNGLAINIKYANMSAEESYKKWVWDRAHDWVEKSVAHRA